MNQKLMQMAETYIKQRRRRVQLFRAVTALALVVAICTSYVLILPGLTLAAETYCGMEEHVHTAECYVDDLSCLIEEREPSKVITEFMSCDFETHVHTSGCRNAVGELCCGYWDKTVHTHDEFCYDNEGVLICTLPEVPQHKHTDQCYSWEETLICELAETEGHQHTDACYILSEEPTCGLEQNDGHHHDANCTVTERTLTCGLDVSTLTDMPHEHTDDCYTVTTTYTCGLEEGEGAHNHTDACYARAEAPICGLEEGEGAHTHGDECYAKERGELTCDKYPEKVHTHSRDCFDEKTGYCVCGYVEVLAHQHTAACIRTVVAEDSGHSHGESCYTRRYTCTLTEHTHGDACYEPVEEETPAEPTATPEVTAVPEEAKTSVPAEKEAEATPEVTEEPTAAPTPAPEADVATGSDLTEDEGEVVPTATVEPTQEPDLGMLLPMGDVGLLGMGDIDLYAPDGSPQWDMNDFIDENHKGSDFKLTGVSIDKTGDDAYHLANGTEYNYKLNVDFDISAYYITQHGESNPVYLELKNFNSDETEIKGYMDSAKNWWGYEQNKWENALDNPAFIIKYDSTKNQFALYFTDKYIDYIKKTYTYTTGYGYGAYWDASANHDGSFYIQGKADRDDLKDQDGESLTITVEQDKDNSKSDTITRRDNEESITNKIEVTKTDNNGGNFDWKTGTFKYKVEVKTSTGTNGNDITLTDTMTLPEGLTGELKVSRVYSLLNNWNDLTVVESNAAFNKDGTCSDATHTTEMHIHRTSTGFIIPPMDNAGDSIIIEYEYQIDKDSEAFKKLVNGNGEITAKAENKIEAVSGDDNTWDYTTKESQNVESTLKTTKLTKSASYQGDGYIEWTLTVNQNYLDITGQKLTDKMLSQVIGEDGSSLVFAPDSGEGVSGITMTDSDGNTTTITADNYQDYFTVSKDGENVSLEFSGDENKKNKNKYEIKYRTYHEPTSEEQKIENKASFGGVEATSTGTVPVADVFAVTKKVTSDTLETAPELNENGEYVVNWETTYTFQAGKPIKLYFGDEIQQHFNNALQFDNHYFTKEQMKAILEQLSGVIDAHGETAYKIELRRRYDNNYEEYTPGSDLTEDQYWGFRFETTGDAGVTLTEENSTLTLRYTSTLKLDAVRQNDLTARNKAFNKNKESYADFNVPKASSGQPKVEKMWGGDWNGIKNLTDLDNDTFAWKIKIDNGGKVLEEITLTDTLPKWVKVVSVKHGASGDWGTEFDAAGDSDSGYQFACNNTDIKVESLSDGYQYVTHNGQSDLKLSLTENEHSQTLNVTLRNPAKRPENVTPKYSDKQDDTDFWKGGTQERWIVITCKLDKAYLDSGVTADNGKYTYSGLSNSVNGTIDGQAFTPSTAQDVTLTYTDQSQKYERLQKSITETEVGNWSQTLTYQVQINAGQEQLSLNGATLTLTDVMKYEEMGFIYRAWPNNEVGYAYQRTVTMGPENIRLYLAATDANGKVKLDSNGNMIKGNLFTGGWSASVENSDVRTRNVWKSTINLNENATCVDEKAITTTLTIPDKTALILEYDVTVSVSVPTDRLVPPYDSDGVGGEKYSLGNLANWGNMTAGLSNTATLTGKESTSKNTSSSDQKFQSTSGGVITTAYNLTIKKVDKDQQQTFLSGTEFGLYKWDGSSFTFVKTMTTDGGQLLFKYERKDDEEEMDLIPNTAYLLVETKAVDPYVLIPSERPVIVFHVWSDEKDPNDETKQRFEDCYPGDWTRDTFKDATKDDLDAQIKAAVGDYASIEGVKTVQGSGNITVTMTNTRPRRTVSVTKSWTGATDDAIPDSVGIALKRYAVPKAKYDAQSTAPDDVLAWAEENGTSDDSFRMEGTLTKAANWQMSFTNLEANGVDASGNEFVYVYYVVEDTVANFTVAYTNAWGDWSDIKSTVNAGLQNTYHKDMMADNVKISLTKAWDESITDTDVPASVNVHLMKTTWTLTRADNGTYSWTEGATTACTSSLAVTKANEWKLNFGEEPIYMLWKDENDHWTGEAYTFTVVEEDTDTTGYTYTLTGALATKPGDYFERITDDEVTLKTAAQALSLADPQTVEVTMTNSMVTEYEGSVSVNLTKTWADKDGVPDKVDITLTPTVWKLKYDTATKAYSWEKYDSTTDPDSVIGSNGIGSAWEAEVTKAGVWKTTIPNNQTGQSMFTYKIEKGTDGIWSGYAQTYTLTEDTQKYDYTVTGLPSQPSEYFEADGITPKKTTDGSVITSYDVALKNTLKTEFEGETFLMLTKKWGDIKQDDEGNDAHSPVTVKISRTRWNWNATTNEWVQEQEGGLPKVTTVSISLNNSNSWEAVTSAFVTGFDSSANAAEDGLPTFYLKYDEDGKLTEDSYVYIYTVTEDSVDGYSTSYKWSPSEMPTKPQDYFTASGELKEDYLYPTEAGVEITNTPLKKIFIWKTWTGVTDDEALDLWVEIRKEDDAAWTPAGITVTVVPTELTAEVTQIAGKNYLHVHGMVTAQSNEWKINISNLPEGTYKIIEVEADGFRSYYNGVGAETSSPMYVGLIASDNDDGEKWREDTLWIENTPTSLTVNKKFALVGNTETSVDVNTTVYFEVWRRKVAMSGDLYRTFTAVDGSEERYTGLKLAATSQSAEGEELKYTVTIESDSSGKDRIKLTVNGTAEAKIELIRLTRYWFDSTTGSRGEWRYYLKEVDADGKELKADIDYGWNWEQNKANTDADLINSSITVTNLVTDITVRKVWLSGDGSDLSATDLPVVRLQLKRSTSSTPQLDDPVISTISMWYDANGEVKAAEGGEGNRWNQGSVVPLTNSTEGSKDIWWGYKWTGLPVYQTDGTPYYYYVVESAVGDGWQQQNDSAATSTPIDATSTDRTFQITNKKVDYYTLPETGGLGTLPYTLGGVALMAAAAFLLGQEMKRRRDGC